MPNEYTDEEIRRMSYDERFDHYQHAVDRLWQLRPDEKEATVEILRRLWRI